MTDWVSKLSWFLLYVIYCGQYRKPRARERVRVSMVTRLCARVERSVLFRMERSPCWLGEQSAPLVVVGWVSKVTKAVVYYFCYGQYMQPQACERARVTMFTRLCVCVEHAVLVIIETSPSSSSSPNHFSCARERLGLRPQLIFYLACFSKN